MMENKNNIKVGYCDYEKPHGHWRTAMTVSGGLFLWTKTANGKSCKKTKCFVRIRSYGSQYDELCKVLQELKNLYNEGKLSEKNFTKRSISLTTAQQMLQYARFIN